MVRQPPARTRTVDVRPVCEEADVVAGIGKLEAQLDCLRAQVRQAQQLAGLGTAAATIAHEVNNLLTPILAYAQSAVDSNDDELKTKALRVTVKNVRLLVSMSERVLELSAATTSRAARVGVRRVVEDAMDSLCRDLSKDGIGFSLEVDESLTAWVDGLQLQQVLFNLLLNARSALAASRSGKIAVSAKREGDRVILAVHDTGPGVPAAMLGHLFDPLQTSKPTSRKGRSRCAGLGLALCRDLIEENGGTIGVTSEAGAGTTFMIVLPAKPPAGPAAP